MAPRPTCEEEEYDDATKHGEEGPAKEYMPQRDKDGVRSRRATSEGAWRSRVSLAHAATAINANVLSGAQPA